MSGDVPTVLRSISDKPVESAQSDPTPVDSSGDVVDSPREDDHIRGYGLGSASFSRRTPEG